MRVVESVQAVDLCRTADCHIGDSIVEHCSLRLVSDHSETSGPINNGVSLNDRQAEAYSVGTKSHSQRHASHG